MWTNCRTYLVPKDRSKPIVTQTTMLISVGYKKNKNKEKVKEEKRDDMKVNKRFVMRNRGVGS